jgi:hypothetical protein
MFFNAITEDRMRLENDFKFIGSRMGMTVAAGRYRLAIFHTVRQVRTPFGK